MFPKICIGPWMNSISQMPVFIIWLPGMKSAVSQWPNLHCKVSLKLPKQYLDPYYPMSLFLNGQWDQHGGQFMVWGQGGVNKGGGWGVAHQIIFQYHRSESVYFRFFVLQHMNGLAAALALNITPWYWGYFIASSNPRFSGARQGRDKSLVSNSLVFIS